MAEITTNEIDRILQLAPAGFVKQGDLIYTDADKSRSIALLTPPVPAPLRIHTLTGFVSLLEAGFEGFDPKNNLVHVESYNEVQLLSTASDRFGRRQALINSTALKPDREFRFNAFMPQEDFNIALRTMFSETPELNDLVKLAGNLSSKAEVGQEDDGFTQRVTAKAGVHMVSSVVVKPRVTLKPIRTFLEVEQPDGDFIFRVKFEEGVGNQCALFEADGGRWRIVAMAIISKWLHQQISTSLVTEINEIPVIC